MGGEILVDCITVTISPSRNGGNSMVRILREGLKESTHISAFHWKLEYFCKILYEKSNHLPTQETPAKIKVTLMKTEE